MNAQHKLISEEIASNALELHQHTNRPSSSDLLDVCAHLLQEVLRLLVTGIDTLLVVSLEQGKSDHLQCRTTRRRRD